MEEEKPKQILALDLGQNTGWALRRRCGDFHSGTERFKPGRFEDNGMTLLRFRSWLDRIHETSGGIDCCVFEEVRRHLGTTACHVYGEFLGQLKVWAKANDIPYLGVPVATIKKHVTGRGNASKEEVVRAIVDRGHTPMDDNEADALSLLFWSIESGPLFSTKGITL